MIKIELTSLLRGTDKILQLVKKKKNARTDIFKNQGQRRGRVVKEHE